MASVMATLDESLKKDIEHFSWVNWSEVAREAFLKKIKRDEAFKRFDEILENSEMTDELASKLGDELKKRVAKRHGL